MKTPIYFISTLCLFLTLVGCIPNKIIRGDGKLVTHTVLISDYNQIYAGGGSMTIHYVQSDKDPFFEITTDENIYDMFEFVVENEEILQIRPKKEYRRNHYFRPTEFIVTTNSRVLEKSKVAGHVEFHVNSPLQADDISFELAGSGSIHLHESVTTNHFHSRIAGSATLYAPQLFCTTLKGDIAGSGTFHLGGTTEKANFDIAGSGDVKALDLISEELKCNIAGSGYIEIHVNKKINADVAGSGKIRYKGEPAEINRSIAGSGSIKKVD